MQHFLLSSPHEVKVRLDKFFFTLFEYEVSPVVTVEFIYYNSSIHSIDLSVSSFYGSNTPG
jgi:hypothetical protein